MSGKNNFRDIPPLINVTHIDTFKVHGIIDGKDCRIIIQADYAEEVLVYFTNNDFYQSRVDFLVLMQSLPGEISEMCAGVDESTLKNDRTVMVPIKAIIDDLLKTIESPLTFRNRLNAAKSLLPPSWIKEYETWLRCEYVENCIDVHKSATGHIAQNLMEGTEEIYFLKRNPAITSGRNNLVEWLHKLFTSLKD